MSASHGLMDNFIGFDLNMPQDRDEEFKEQLAIINSMSQFYIYIYSFDLVTEMYREIYVDGAHVRTIMGETGNISISIKDMCRMLLKPEYISGMVDFTDISTMGNRLNGKKYITYQYEGINTGWLEAILFPGAVDENGVLTKAIFAVRDINYEKNKESQLLYNSYVDDLTQLYNRKMYNENILEYDKSANNNMVFLSVDVNGLKIVNDSLGHDAGDELIMGVADCLKKCFAQYGRVYRLGGDEFAAVIYISPANLPRLIGQFNGVVESWHGKLVESLSISMGYVTRAECSDRNIYEMAKIADQRMYRDKEQYYALKGVDRTGRQSAHNALSCMYEKVLKLNLTTNSYQIIHIDEEEFKKFNCTRYTLSVDIKRYAESGYIHDDDHEKFFKSMDTEFLKDYFAGKKAYYSFSYRRLVGEKYLPVTTEMVRADDYSKDNQTVFLFVKKHK
ncbi:GGDEF domain-containing protein [Anaerovibrio sp. RM50]|uniref:GGDEF domain-containing protein n=1 Tax=Anaerovibrio sp. RM50 TaxID=1200557 RepID=UPI000489155A|nr:GGDEF domain-containing protein [Anaerovibrio sp. RM50]